MNPSGRHGHFHGKLLNRLFTPMVICAIFLLAANLSVLPAYGQADRPSEKRAHEIPPDRTADAIGNRAVWVTVRPIVRKPAVVTVEATGRLQEEVSTLYFKIPGSMENLFVEEGDSVRAGQVLAELDKEDAVNKFNLEKVRLERIREQHKVKRSLFEAKAISYEDYEDFLKNMKVSEIHYDMARLHLNYCTLRAPARGIILRRFFDYPTAVKAGTAVFLFKSADDPWVVSLRVSDKNAHAIKSGDRVHVHFPIYPEETFAGQVLHVSRSADPTDGLFKVKVTFDDSGRQFLSGMFARARITHAEAIQRFHVPVAGLLEMRGNRGGIFVLSPDSDRARRIDIGVYSISGTEAVLETDLQGFDRIIVGGKQNVFDGVRVKIAHEDRN